MPELNFLNDAPIQHPDNDRFGIDSFAQALASSIKRIHSPVGATIAITGQWGSGKSSAVNLIRFHLQEEVQAGRLEIIDFRCWWFRGEEALTLAFLRELNATLQKSIGYRARELLPRIGKTLLQAGPVIGPAMNIATGGLTGPFSPGAMEFARRLIAEGESLEKLFRQLSEVLEKQEKRFLVLVDDIDRLTSDEALLMFRLVKSVGRLPNVLYLLVFDRTSAVKAISQRYPSEGSDFLEKIIQASFELPLPPRDDLNSAVLAQISNICGPIDDNKKMLRFMNIFHDAVAPYLNTPRDLNRLTNVISISWPPVANEVDVADYIALETIRLFEPTLHNAIRKNKERLCGVRSGSRDREEGEVEIGRFLELVVEETREQTKAALLRLFPRLESASYGSGFVEEWEAQRLVCTEAHFDTYFRMSIGDDTLSKSEIDEFIDQCNDEVFVEKTFRDALGTIRKNGKSKVPLLLDEINVHASRIDMNNFQPLISTIFRIADDIDRDEDREAGGISFGNTHLRIHWLIRALTFEQRELAERSQIFLAACQSAQVGWLTDFTDSAVKDYFPRDGSNPEPTEKCLIEQDSLTELKRLALAAISAAAEEGRLVTHLRLPHILFGWRNLADDNSTAVRAWTDEQMASDVAVAYLAKAFTGERWTQGMGMGELGDTVAMRSPNAQIEGLETILDVEMFRARLEELERGDGLESPYKEYIQVFLDAWRERESGKGW